MKLSVIIVNYNVKYFLDQCLHSVQKALNGIESEIIVVDNNSTDGSDEMIVQNHKEVKLIINKENVGYAKANNQGIIIAKGSYILLLNPDTIVAEDTFQKSLEFIASHADAGALGLRMIDGSGVFLPESKRGFPTPQTAFYKTFGLSSIFKKSKTFNNYHLGYISEFTTSKVDVLSGAYMLFPKVVLDKIGLLDEQFFMYGEDIDISYRVKKAGYENYYFADTTIIHYKGESTKKGSINYLKTFYNAMILFVKKHFTGVGAKSFILLLHFAIYFRALLTLISNLVKKYYSFILDFAGIVMGMYFLKNFWSVYYYKDIHYYKHTLIYSNAIMYAVIWIISIFFSGGYDQPRSFKKILRGILFGTILIAAIYGFLDENLRTSRILIILGMLWTIGWISFFRIISNFVKYKTITLSEDRPRKTVIIGNKNNFSFIERFLLNLKISKNLLGHLDDSNTKEHRLGSVNQLESIIKWYDINELIFCADVMDYKSMIGIMSKMKNKYFYKILATEQSTIVGSNSKNSTGELYTHENIFKINSQSNKRNKRVFDLVVCFILTCLSPLFLLLGRFRIIKDIFDVLSNKKTWVSYDKTVLCNELPRIKDGIITTTINYQPDEFNIQKMNYEFAKNYALENEFWILWRSRNILGK
jgi:GT2 family glycosyltransferase